MIIITKLFKNDTPFNVKDKYKLIKHKFWDYGSYIKNNHKAI